MVKESANNKKGRWQIERGLAELGSTEVHIGGPTPAVKCMAFWLSA
jgi:hypothetical protein